MTVAELITAILDYVAENDRGDILNKQVTEIDIDKDGIFIQTNKDTIWLE